VERTTEVFCDFLSITTPHDDWSKLQGELDPLFDLTGASVDLKGSNVSIHRLGEGTCKQLRRGSVCSISATGAFLTALRAVNSFRGYLAALSTVPHRVTRLDATMDVREDAAPVIRALTAAVNCPDGLSVTRKRLKRADCTRYLTTRDDGQESGTLYLGQTRADVRPVVYDKQLERQSKGYPDPGPLTRYECRVRSRVGPTLRDADNPTALFWHLMSPAILPRPPSTPPWSSCAEGYVLPPMEQTTAAARLVRRVETSPDIEALLLLTHGVGEEGLPLLLRTLRRLHAGLGGAGVTPART